MTEKRAKTRGKVWGVIKEGQNSGLQLTMNNLLYNGAGLHDYTTIDLNPYYTLANDYWHVRVGANVDFSLGQGQGIRVSPDVTAECVFGESYVLYVTATGCRILNAFFQLEIINTLGSMHH